MLYPAAVSLSRTASSALENCILLLLLSIVLQPGKPVGSEAVSGREFSCSIPRRLVLLVKRKESLPIGGVVRNATTHIRETA